MNHPSFAPSLHEYQSLELQAHISLDDVITKVSEEAYELREALSNNDPREIQKEAHDVLMNVISASSKLTDMSTLHLTPWVWDITELDTLIALWSRQTASLRGRYSREKISLEQYRATLAPLLSILLSLSGKWELTDVIGESVAKFRSRVQGYLPDICLEDYIWAHADFPKPGILFRDISPLLADPEAFRYASFEMARHAQDADVIAGLDARGFLFWARIAEILEKPFVMIRKKGKLPGDTVGTHYSLEYGDNSIEIQKNAIKPGQKVAIIDDLLATWGTLEAAAGLIEKVGGTVEALICLIALDEPFLRDKPSRKNLAKYKEKSVLHYL
jgi:adenine phosphoribosyltransferase